MFKGAEFMNNPLVSVIIPVYNSEKYIRETIESVQKQSYSNLEIIVIDDGSKDNSSKIINEIKDTRISYQYQPNKGVSAARNHGIKVSTGDFLAFLDSDDLWKTNKLELEMKLLLKSNAEACYCGIINYYEETKSYVNAKTKFKNGDILFYVLKDKIYAHTSTWIIKKETLIRNDICFTEGCHWGEDLEFFVKVASITRVCCVKEYLSIYRKRTDDCLSNISFKQFDEIKVLKRLKIWLKENDDVMYDKKLISNLIDNFRIPYTIARILHFECSKHNFDKSIICMEYNDEVEILRKHVIILGDYYHKLKYFIFRKEFLIS